MTSSAARTLGILLAGGLSLWAGTAQADGPPPPARDPYAYAPPPEQLFYNWSGLYAGVLVGGSTARWAGIVDTGVIADGPRGNSNDVVLGGQIGYQHQIRDFVIGAEVSYSALGAKVETASLVAPGLTLSQELASILHVNGKIGYAYMNYLAYAKAGYAIGAVKTATGGALTASSSTNANGWMGGVGVSYAAHRNFILSVEYDYTRLNVDNVTLSDTVQTANFSGSRWDVQQVMLRFDFKLGPH